MTSLFMQEALSQGELGRLLAPPNPWVGCVIVKEGKVVGKGFTQRPGGPHAEVMALRDAGSLAKGGDLYVTLEPCCHHGRTPPCVDAILESGIGRVFAAIEDPDPQVKGRGISTLREAGVHVEVGDGQSEALRSLRPYLHHRKTGRPWVVLKTALSLDGRTAAQDGTSQWITSLEARQDAHSLRARSQAIAVGAGTALADDPALTVRLCSPLPPTPPLRVLFDRRGRTPATAKLFSQEAPTLVVTSDQIPSEWANAWKSRGADVTFQPTLGTTLEELGSRGVLQLMVEGGAHLQGAFLMEGLMNELVVYIGGRILGDQGLPAFVLPIPSLEAAPHLHLEEVTLLGDNLRLRYLPSQRKERV